jgi:hypothetical protein
VRDVIGRESELGVISAFLDRSVEGPAGLVLEGDPGIGKSTLWLEAVTSARERGAGAAAAQSPPAADLEHALRTGGRGGHGRARLGQQDLSELKPYGFDTSTPLWHYALKEAQVTADGLHLGPVAGRIVAEVLIGLLQSDPSSYLVQQPTWQPTLQNPGSGFRMTDFLTYAGVDPKTRHAQQPKYA